MIALLMLLFVMPVQAQSVNLLLGTQIGTLVSIETSGVRLQYSDAQYVADAPSYWTTKRWSIDVGQHVGDTTMYLGYVNLDYQPIGSGWSLAYSDIELGVRSGWWDIAVRPNGFDISVQ